jgi:hypothetical protein
MSLEGIVSKRADAAYATGNRGLWLKAKCLHREEFVVVDWPDPRQPTERSRRTIQNDETRNGPPWVEPLCSKAEAGRSAIGARPSLVGRSGDGLL